jgi:nitroreductase
MEPIQPTRLLDALKWRYATKQFDPSRKIDPAVWEVLEEALVLSASSFGLQPWKFLVVTDQAVKEALVGVSWGQRQVADASHVVVFARKDLVDASDVAAHMDHTAEVRGVARSSLDGFEKVVLGFLGDPPDSRRLAEWASRQVYLALGNFLTSAALLGIDACPMEGLDPAAYDRILGLEGSGFSTLAACPVGFRHPGDKYASAPKVRFPKTRTIQHIP